MQDSLSPDTLKGITDVDDMYLDSLKEQALELDISLDGDSDLGSISPPKEKGQKKKSAAKPIGSMNKKEKNQLKKQI